MKTIEDMYTFGSVCIQSLYFKKCNLPVNIDCSSICCLPICTVCLFLLHVRIFEEKQVFFPLLYHDNALNSVVTLSDVFQQHEAFIQIHHFCNIFAGLVTKTNAHLLLQILAGQFC